MNFHKDNLFFFSYDIINPYAGLGQAQKCNILMLMGSQSSPIDNIKCIKTIDMF
jgi:hypothetical protein